MGKDIIESFPFQLSYIAFFFSFWNASACIPMSAPMYPTFFLHMILFCWSFFWVEFEIIGEWRKQSRHFEVRKRGNQKSHQKKSNGGEADWSIIYIYGIIISYIYNNWAVSHPFYIYLPACQKIRPTSKQKFMLVTYCSSAQYSFLLFLIKGVKKRRERKCIIIYHDLHRASSRKQGK